MFETTIIDPMTTYDDGEKREKKREMQQIFLRVCRRFLLANSEVL